MTIIRFWLGLAVPTTVADTERGTEMCVEEKVIGRKLE
jgi:hypothetical protein